MMVRKEISKRKLPGASLVVQWLRCHVSTAWGTGSTPAQGAKILCHTTWPKNRRGGGGRKLPNIFNAIFKLDSEQCNYCGLDIHVSISTLHIYKSIPEDMFIIWLLDKPGIKTRQLYSCGVPKKPFPLGANGPEFIFLCQGTLSPQPWIVIERTDAEAEAEAPILWPPDAKNWLIGKDPDAGKN